MNLHEAIVSAQLARKIPPVVAVKTINLALQGGGAHGAFTWGVLDRLLEDEPHRFRRRGGDQRRRHERRGHDLWPRRRRP